MSEIPGERHELKFLIGEDLVPALRRFLAPYCIADRFTQRYPLRGYPITTTYFDSPDLAMARSAIDGERDRVKLRVRAYEPGAVVVIAPEGRPDPRQVFFEIKRKANGVVMKRRACVARACAAELMEGQSLRSAALERLNGSGPVVADFFNLCRLQRCRPVLAVSYRREAYECLFHQYVRVTFDRDLSAAIPGADGLPGGEHRGTVRPVPLGGTVFEVKFTGSYPRWVAEMIRRFELRRRSIPKYVLCAQAVGAREYPLFAAWMRRRASGAVPA